MIPLLLIFNRFEESLLLDASSSLLVYQQQTKSRLHDADS
jgi:hypothetical protein